MDRRRAGHPGLLRRPRLRLHDRPRAHVHDRARDRAGDRGRDLRSRGRRRARDRPPPDDEIGRLFAHTLVPIAAAYVLAHYFSLLAYNGQAITFISSDPLGKGWDLFGTADGTIDYALIGATVIWYVQVAVLIGGHVCGSSSRTTGHWPCTGRRSRRRRRSTGCWPSWSPSRRRGSSSSPRRINDGELRPDDSAERGMMRFLPPLAGHTGYNPGNVPPGDSGGDGGPGGGLGAPWIFAARSRAGRRAALVWLSPGSTRTRLRALAPKVLILVHCRAARRVGGCVPEGRPREARRRALGQPRRRGPADRLSHRRGHEHARDDRRTQGRPLECFDRDGQIVLDAAQRWPFRVNEAGYDYPHVHQTATREQLQQADRCELRGTRVRLEAEVKGVLPS